MAGWLFGSAASSTMVTPDRALPGRDDYAYPVPATHAVLGTPLRGPWPEGTAVISLALGCFWGAEKALWNLPGVVTTAAGYQGGYTPYPTYEETCTSLTGHTETVLVAYDPTVLPHVELLRTFWTLHDPTQGFRQGNDRGSQYRSAVYWTTPEQEAAVLATRDAYAPQLAANGFGEITTELRSAADAGPFYYAEDYHQQYLHKVPNGYCPVHSTGVACPVPA
ncbi:peptide-methionine (S)-S-oxide reductase MsrA [Cellulomonas sp. P24]|uniref:peptide-methionine (S)-S-oxide reductase MsrA n=1 Tax=Cellulomonas sp. P24 TaxID=2885206 RepID=UPI00216ADE72|nr:peptide-methionine (S)-S-oxide reductase MsrA [Cellulomonas sp. P24]MCR6493817.1 peptide-methionine (S)-S-oxide reductase MsrA [Cellulomonas sp. P24]